MHATLLCMTVAHVTAIARAEICDGTAGHYDLSRRDFREQGALPYICDGSQYTCVQDSLVVAARWVLRELRTPVGSNFHKV